MNSTKDLPPDEPLVASSISADINAHPTNNEHNEAYSLKYRLRSFFARCRHSQDSDTLAPYQELIISQKVFHRSVNCLRFAVFVDAIAGTVEQPNYREFLLLVIKYTTIYITCCRSPTK
jgi:hypothetical protein